MVLGLGLAKARLTQQPQQYLFLLPNVKLLKGKYENA